jgi:hypothetical protein
MNHYRIKTIVTLYRGKTGNRRRTWMIMHVRDGVKSFQTSVTSHGSVTIQQLSVYIIYIMTPHMCDKFVHG